MKNNILLISLIAIFVMVLSANKIDKACHYCARLHGGVELIHLKKRIIRSDSLINDSLLVTFGYPGGKKIMERSDFEVGDTLLWECRNDSFLVYLRKPKYQLYGWRILQIENDTITAVHIDGDKHFKLLLKEKPVDE